MSNSISVILIYLCIFIDLGKGVPFERKRNIGTIDGSNDNDVKDENLISDPFEKTVLEVLDLDGDRDISYNLNRKKHESLLRRIERLYAEFFSDSSVNDEPLLSVSSVGSNSLVIRIKPEALKSDSMVSEL